MTLNIDLEDSYRIGFIGIDDYKAGTCLAGLAHNLTRSGENILNSFWFKNNSFTITKNQWIS